MHVQSCCFAYKTYCFLRSRCRPRFWIVKSLIFSEMRYSLRDSVNNWTVAFPRTNFMKNSFSHREAWKSLPYDMRETKSWSQFKRLAHLNFWLLSLHGIHEKQVLIRLAVVRFCILLVVRLFIIFILRMIFTVFKLKKYILFYFIQFHSILFYSIHCVQSGKPGKVSPRVVRKKISQNSKCHTSFFVGVCSSLGVKWGLGQAETGLL